MSRPDFLRNARKVAPLEGRPFLVEAGKMGYRGGAPSGSVARVELDFSGSPGRPGVRVLNGLEGKNLNGMDPDEGPGPGVLLYLEFIRRENR